MSPTAFKSQLESLILLLEKCDSLCQLIRQNRRLGSTSYALDEFQHALLSSASKLDSRFKSYRIVLGSRMDLGDDVSRYDLQQCIRVTELTIQQRLNELAYGQRTTRDPEQPGFRRLLERWTKVFSDVNKIIEGLAARIDVVREREERGRAEMEKEKERGNAMNGREIDELVEHMKNCWVEKEIHGERAWINAFDQKKIVYVRPTGFIKATRHVRVEEPERWRGNAGW